MLKLFMSDVDGTLLQKGETQLSESCKKRLLALTNSGVKFAAVSGRDPVSLRRLFAFLPDAYLVGCNGAVCVKGEKTLYSRPISASNVILAWKHAIKTRQNIVFSSDNTMYVLGSKEFVSKTQRLDPDKTVLVKSITELSERIYKISFFDEAENAGLPMPPFELKVFYDRNGWREYVNRFAGKGDAASDLQMRLGVGRASCAAAGNEMADADLLNHAGYKFSFCDILARETGAVRVPSVNSLFDELDRIP